MMEEKKWRPFHEIALELLDLDLLLEDPLAESTIITFARAYALRAKAPREAIPKLIEAFQAAHDEFTLESKYEVIILMAIDTLKRQLAEYEAEEKKKTPKVCPDCGGRLDKVYQPMDSPLNHDQWEAEKRGDLRCAGKCKKFYFFADGELKPGYND